MAPVLSSDRSTHGHCTPLGAMNRLWGCSLQPHAPLAFCWPRIVVLWSSKVRYTYRLPASSRSGPVLSLSTTVMCGGMRCSQPVASEAPVFPVAAVAVVPPWRLACTHAARNPGAGRPEGGGGRLRGGRAVCQCRLCSRGDRGVFPIFAVSWCSPITGGNSPMVQCCQAITS